MNAPKKIFYESRLSAFHNVRLMIARQVDALNCYCLGYNKAGVRKSDFDGYYTKSELTQIQNPN